MKLTTFSIVAMMMDFLLASGSRYCPWSKDSAKKVESCPLTDSDIKKRANNTNCEYLAKVQNCTIASNFKYHCLINEFENAFFEVCAESYYIVSGKYFINSLPRVICSNLLNCEATRCISSTNLFFYSSL